MRIWQRPPLAIIALSCVCLVTGCRQNVRNLGGGFAIVHQPPSERSPRSSETRHLYFGSKDLGTVGACFISPSTCHAIYEHEGKLMLFHSCSETVKPITDLRGVSPAHVTWSETRNEAKISLLGKTNIIQAALSTYACRTENRPFARNP